MDDVAASGERPTDGLVGLPPHDDRLSPGERTKPPEVRRKAPRQPVVVADDPVPSDRGDDREDHRLYRFRGANGRIAAIVGKLHVPVPEVEDRRPRAPKVHAREGVRLPRALQARLLDLVEVEMGPAERGGQTPPARDR